jgi:SAM-dependent methyltransferase
MADTKSKSCWFENWFDSEYYHLLYKDRDYAEAEAFIRTLVEFLKVGREERILDLACGKGRHSIFLNALGFDVLGVDLSENSISSAKKSEREGLQFRVGDMREPQGNTEFDLVLNLFTSFGYFDCEEENLKTLSAIHHALKPGGRLVIDFMNSEKVVQNLVPHARITKGGIEFDIEKSIENQVIRKVIRFSDKGKDWFFEERVQVITRADFIRYFEKTGFEFVHLSGDYQLNSYQEKQSDRMILIVRKPDRN